MNVNEVMGAYEVAELLNVSHVTVYYWVRNGLHGTIEKKIGRKDRIVFTVNDLLEYFNAETLDELLERRSK